LVVAITAYNSARHDIRETQEVSQMPKSEYHGARRSTIYALCDPETREIRYIGKTSRTLKQRLRQHLRDAEEGDKSRCSSYRLRWLRSLGAQPVIVSLLITSESFGIEME